MSDLVYKEESYNILGACFEVYKRMGCGFLESVYQECLEIELKHQSIPFVSQPKLELSYRQQPLCQIYRPDFICYDKITLEIKAISRIIDEHRAQILNYLNAGHFKLGLLINFGHHPKLEHERFVL